MMNRMIIALLVMGIAALGCSGTGSAPMFSEPITAASETTRHHALWGYWCGIIDTDAETIEFTQLRTTEFHLNALPFLEPPPMLNLTLESLEFNEDVIEADIGLRHPFLGLTEFTGFDVCGIFITNGSVSGFSDPDLRMAGEGDTRLLNADGYSRWWNPDEFPVNNGTIFGYTDGLLGAPDSYADYTATLNGYKYFCDDLDSTPDTVDDVVLGNRGMFSAGQKNVRHYTIQLGGEGLIFNYAIDACWQFPEGDAPWQAPDDFGETANRAEAWKISVDEVENTLWNDGESSGGDLSLTMDVYDWVNADLNTVTVESTGNFDPASSSTAIGGGDGYSTYEIEILDAAPLSAGSIELFVTVACDEEGYGGLLPGKTQAAYFMYSTTVGGEAPATNKNIELPYDILDIGVRDTTGEPYVLFDNGQLWIYNEDYSSGEFKINTSLNRVDPCDGGDAPMGVTTSNIGQYVYWRDNNTLVYKGYTYPLLDLANGLSSGTADRPYYWHSTGSALLSVRRSIAPPTFGGNVASFNILGSGSGLINPSAFRGLHVSRLNPDPTYSMWCYGLEGDPEFVVERFDYYSAGGWHSMYSDLTLFGTQGDGHDQLNDPRDISGDYDDNIYVLDILSTGQPVVKVYDCDGVYLCQFGSSSTISGTPLRLDVDEGDGEVHIAHTDGVSIFTADEIPLD